MSEITMNELVALCKNRGFIFAGSEIYGGLSNTWDYGPLGVELKNNLKRAWWQEFVEREATNVGLDSAILMNPQVWVASGHLANFTDPLMDCRACKSRVRADKLIEEWLFNNNKTIEGSVEAMGDEKMEQFIKDNNICCPHCNKCDFTPIRKFNLMFKTFQGVTEDKKSEIYLRPETAGGIFVNFKNVLRSTRGKLPLGIGQIGKSFRNEITPGNFIFRVREFEQMELEFFFDPQDGKDWFTYYRQKAYDFLLSLGIDKQNLRFRDHDKEELSFYSVATTDIEYTFPFGWGELWGIANRTDHDLTQHQKFSGQDMSYLDPFTNRKFIPHVIEPSVGVDRVLLALLCSAYTKEKLENGEERVVMRFKPKLAPIKVAVLPLSNKLISEAEKVYQKLAQNFRCEFDTSGSIGKRYRRQDEIGTPYCVTVDFDTLNDGCVTIRDRDTMKQERIKIDEIMGYVAKKLAF